MHFVQLHQRIFGKVFNVVVCCWHHDQNCAASVVVIYTIRLQHNSILYYYTVAEMHIFLSEVELKSTGKSITCT